MRVLEDDAKVILARHGVRVPQGRVCSDPESAFLAAAELGPVAVKALVAQGGRGKLGLVKLAKTPEAARDAASDILGRDASGEAVDQLLVEEWISGREIFLAWTYDFDSRGPVLLASAHGGMEVEDDLSKDRGSLVRWDHDPRRDFFPYEGRRLAFEKLGLTGRAASAFGVLASQLWEAFRESDAWLLEVNPAVVLADGTLAAVDAVLELDDNAASRHPEWASLASDHHSTELEAQVEEADRLDPHTGGVRFQEIDGGDVLYLVFGGGAGLAYFDYVREKGFKPATYVDLSPGRGVAKVRRVFDAAFSLPTKRAVIMTLPHANLASVDQIVEQLVESYESVSDKWAGVPVVVRVCGPGEERAYELLKRIPCVAFGDEVTIDEAIDSVLDRLTEDDAKAGV
jgi:succinyl-CoA synthetase beta subunit